MHVMPTLLEQLDYGYDRNSRRTWRKRSLASGQDDAYGYDGLSQVVNAARGNLNLNATAIGGVPVEAEGWDYDGSGNWHGYRVEEDGAVTLEQERVHDRGNRLMQVEGGGAGTVLVDRAGRMTEVPPDGSGDRGMPLKLVWDAWSRLVSVSDDAHGEIANYSYDGLSRRMTRTVGGVTWHSYYSDTWRPLEERRDSQTSAAKQYYWGARHRDDLVRRDRATSSGGSLDEVRYVLMYYFSPAAITDGSGTVTERYGFSAFGVRRIMAPDFSPRSASEYAWDFAFQGQFLDTESGFYDYGYRYYSPSLGRWLSKDPIEEKGGINLYGFAENNGVNGVDQLGLKGPLPPSSPATFPAVPSYPPTVPPTIPDSPRPMDIPTGDGSGANGLNMGFLYWMDSFFHPTQPTPPPEPEDPADWEDVIDPTGRIYRRRRLRWCLPCQPPVGTEAYRHDKTPPEGNSRPHKPCPACHVHWYIVVQRPSWIPKAGKPCLCEWLPNRKKPNTHDGVECVKKGWQGPQGISQNGDQTPLGGGGLSP